MGRKKKNETTDQPVLNVAANESSKRQSQDAASSDVKSVIGSPEESETEKETKYYNELRKFLIPKLRSASYRWPARNEAVKAARKSRGIYECASCSSEMKNGEFIIDHREPVVPLEGWSGRDWTMYVTRMFCSADNFQLLCKMCSTIKSDTEVQLRKMYRQRKKDERKD